VYWVIAAAMVAAYWPSVPLRRAKRFGRTSAAALAVRVVQKALRAPPLARVLHEALWR
jgi:hypothetical protein